MGDEEGFVACVFFLSPLAALIGNRTGANDVKCLGAEKYRLSNPFKLTRSYNIIVNWPILFQMERLF